MVCSKQYYPTKLEALKVMRRMQRDVRQGPLPIRVYYCPEHKGWEVTSKPKRKGSDNNGR